MSSRSLIRRGMPQAGALLKKSFVNSDVRWATSWREARKLSEHITYQSYGLLQSSITNDMTSAQLRALSLTARLYSSEQAKSETLRLDLRIMSNEMFCPNCRFKLGFPSNKCIYDGSHRDNKQ